MAEFNLHPQLAKDTLLIGDLPLCRLLLMNQKQFPWLILVPKRPNLREIFELTEADYATLSQEIKFVSKTFSGYTKAHKMNIAALGNMVPQLHVHIIARFENDAAWPNPVWNSGAAQIAYEEAEAAGETGKLASIFGI